MRSLLLLHGALGSAAHFDGLAAALQPDFNVFAPHLEGHGGRGLPAAFSISGFADDVLAYLDANQIDQIDVFGYSMGGYVALYLALHHPERIGKIFTLATKFDWTPESAARESGKLNPQLIQEKVPGFASELAHRHHPQDWKVLLTQTADMMLQLGQHPPLSQNALSFISHHCVIAVGTADRMVSMEESQQASEALPNATFRIFSDVQHPIEKVSEDMLAQALREFL